MNNSVPSTSIEFLKDSLYRNFLKDQSQTNRVSVQDGKILKSCQKKIPKTGQDTRSLNECRFQNIPSQKISRRKADEAFFSCQNIPSKISQNKHDASAVIPYNIKMKECQTLEEAKNIFKELRLRKIQPDLYTYNSYLKHLIKNPFNSKDVDAFISEMEKLQIEPDITTYNLLIEGYERQGKDDEGIELFNKMKILGNVWTYNVMMNFYRKKGKDFAAIILFEEMQPLGIAPNIMTYNILFDILKKGGKHDNIIIHFKEMQALGIKPNVVTYKILQSIDLQIMTPRILTEDCGKYGNDDAVALFEIMQMLETEPADATIFFTLINAYRIRKRYNDAIALFEKMKKLGIEPDVTTHYIMTVIYGNQKKI